MSALPQVQLHLETDESAAELQLRESQKMEAIGRLVSGVAHDFNNLLTGIVLCSDLLLAGLAKDSRLRRYAQEIRTAGAHGAGMIQQLLAVARPRAPELRSVSLNEVIQAMGSLLTRLIGENIVLSTQLAADLAPVTMDPAQIQQIILNLVLNARDAMPDGGRITLCTRNCDTPLASPAAGKSPANYVQLEVRDSGCGMDNETRRRVFEPFFSTKSEGQGHGLGHGLGLATVYSILKHAGGTVEIESAPGKGTRVIIRLPGTPPDQETSAEVTGRSRPLSQSAAPDDKPGD